MESIKIGSQLFINHGDSPKRITELVRKMNENGLSLIRLFMIWDQLEPKENCWDFTSYDTCFDEAAKLNMKVIPTLMSVSPPGWMRMTKGPQSNGDLDDLTFWQGAAKNYVQKLVYRYQKHTALHSWILWNEPGRTPIEGEHSKKAFQMFLEEKYQKDINKLNEKYYEQYEKFSDVESGSLKRGPAFESYEQKLDWIWYIVYNLDNKLKDIYKWVREIDKTTPIHVNPHNVGQNLLPVGQSIWNQGKYTDFLGCSAHVPWHSGRFASDRIHQSIAYYADLMKSATTNPKGLFWVTELQGGPTWYSSPKASCPSYEDINYWIWESIGSGARAVIFWCFNSRIGGDEAGEWNLLNLLDEPSERLLAAKKAASVLLRNREVFDVSKPVSPQVLLMDSQHTKALNIVETEEETDKMSQRNRQMSADALSGAYLMCSDLGLSVQIINEELLATGSYPKEAKVLLFPETTALDYESLLAISKYQEAGGTVIADGLFGLKDPLGNINKGHGAMGEQIFGVKIKDIRGLEEKNIAEKTNEGFPSWFVQIDIENIFGQALAYFKDGNPAVVKSQKKQGAGFRINTVFFRQYMIEGKGELLSSFRSLLPEMVFEAPVVHVNPSHTLRLRRLSHTDGEILILINTSEEITSILQFNQKGVLARLDEDEQETYNTDKEFLIGMPMAPKSTKVFLWTTDTAKTTDTP